MPSHTYIPDQKIADFVQRVLSVSAAMQVKFNEKKFVLSDLSASRRIFLFFFARALKTFSAVFGLCECGYGQDASSLLRSLLDNLISVRYIFNESATADQKAVRFVDYKWIIFKKNLDHEAQSLRFEHPMERAVRDSITTHAAAFKQKYHILSDKALLTWSGKTVRDMAKAVSRDLLREYESNFRLCSRFSHPTIVGDKEYMGVVDERLVFSSQPSSAGVVAHLGSAVRYLIEFLQMFDRIFSLDMNDDVALIGKSRADIFPLEPFDVEFPDGKKPSQTISRHNLVQFRVVK